MINGKSVIAIIPARTNSKGLPGKNIKELCGKPLSAWSIEAGLTSKFIDVVVVSTDSQEIVSIAHDYGASAPFIRPQDLSTDEAKSFFVIKHALEYYQSEFNKSFDYTVLLEPTSPQRDWVDIDEAMQELDRSPQAKSIVGISKTQSQNPAFLVKMKDDHSLTGFGTSEIGSKRRQEVEDVYFLEGSIYISETEYLLRMESFYHDATVGYIFPKWKSYEIDDIDDFTIIEALMAKNISK
jgi:N-acylneuraminate cytidylyltransferase/CMP-N,N'-diacetyllegionaminic acid synthase